MSAAAPGKPSELDPAGITNPGVPSGPPGAASHHQEEISMQTQPHPRDPALRPLPRPGHAGVPARLARALARAGRRAHDAAAGYHRTQLPPFRTASRAPFSGFRT